MKKKITESDELLVAKYQDKNKSKYVFKRLRIHQLHRENNLTYSFTFNILEIPIKVTSKNALYGNLYLSEFMENKNYPKLELSILGCVQLPLRAYLLFV